MTAARSEKRIRWEMRHPGVVWVGKSASGRTVAHLHKLGREWEWMVVPDDVERPLRREKVANIYAAKRAAQEAFSAESGRIREELDKLVRLSEEAGGYEELSDAAYERGSTRKRCKSCAT